MSPLAHLLSTGCAVFLLVLVTGCAGPAPNYAPSIDNVELLKGSVGTPVKAGAIGLAPDLKTGASITLRANTMASPVGNHFGDYIAAALRQELEMARLYDPQSTIEVSGILLRNDVNAGGFASADGLLGVRFVVRQLTQLRFDKTIQVRHQWESSFAGAVAIPLAANNYPVMVQKLLTQLISDPEFVRALRP